MSKVNDTKHHHRRGDHSNKAAHAGRLARAEVDRMYELSPPQREHQRSAPIVSPRTAKHKYTPHSGEHPAQSETVTVPKTYDRHHATPEQQAENNQQFNWHQYHSEWQRYYQHYYGRYYQQQFSELHRRHAEQKAREAATRTTPSHPQSQRDIIKNELLERISERTRILRKSNHFMPIVTALCVGLVFLILQYNKLMLAQVNAYISPSQTISDNVIVDPDTTAAVGKQTRLIIPKINVDVPIVLGLETFANNVVQKALEKGVAQYPIPGANSLPGQKGNFVVGGHSSNDVFAAGSHKFAFVLLERLEAGDLFYVHYQQKRYVYRVTEKQVILPANLKAIKKSANAPIATLVTCTPIGTDDKRLLVVGEQISPDPARAEAAPDTSGDQKDSNLPGNEPGFLQRLFGT